MKKFECKGCRNHCVVTTNDTCCPVLCHLVYEDWHEVKEAVTDCNQLPDWCKVGRCGYDNEQERYFEVIDIDKKWVDIEYLDDGNGATCSYTDMQNCSEAHKRPFNAEEMKALVGKVMQDKLGNRSLVNKYLITYNEIVIFNAFYTPQKLFESDFTIDGKPCYKLECLENGEWVE